MAAPTIQESRPAQNIFSKKRLIDEISKPSEPTPLQISKAVNSDDVEMAESEVHQPDENQNIKNMASANV